MNGHVKTYFSFQVLGNLYVRGNYVIYVILEYFKNLKLCQFWFWLPYNVLLQLYIFAILFTMPSTSLSSALKNVTFLSSFINYFFTSISWKLYSGITTTNHVTFTQSLNFFFDLLLKRLIFKFYGLTTKKLNNVLS